MNQYQMQFRNFMEDKGLRVTRQRLSVAGLLFEMTGHPTIVDLYVDLRATETGISLATVYRTLKLLKDAGLAVEFQIDDGAARVEAVNTHTTHDHLICRNCGTVVEMHNPAIQKTQAQLAQEHGFILENQAYCVYGLCSDCHARHQTGEAS
ncbi:MAG: transcriptional repressor [Candidatus Adiutrix sp.]|jgi:Fur family ferric uptake transcriptional regulator|nr:transcriptional repressor [Candidatus Adiutrix sp.]